MDEVVKVSQELQKKLIEKYELNKTQVEVLNRAIANYDYEQNEGDIFTDQFAIMSLFCADEVDEATAPTGNCVFALCEYIIGTIDFYNLDGYSNSNADKVALDILQHSAIYEGGE